jgi:hypothetical protein
MKPDFGCRPGISDGWFTRNRQIARVSALTERLSTARAQLLRRMSAIGGPNTIVSATVTCAVSALDGKGCGPGVENPLRPNDSFVSVTRFRQGQALDYCDQPTFGFGKTHTCAPATAARIGLRSRRDVTARRQGADSGYRAPCCGTADERLMDPSSSYHGSAPARRGWAHDRNRRRARSRDGFRVHR